MNLDQQVISLQHAKRLKELGVNNDSFFAYFKLNMPPTYDDWEVSKQTNSKIGLPAYSVAELLDLLPEFPEPYKLNFGIEFNQLRETMGGKYYCVCDRAEYPRDEYFYDDNFANALAKMLIFLIEQKLWSPK